jgi:hypothetical protein
VDDAGRITAVVQRLVLMVAVWLAVDELIKIKVGYAV